MNAPSDPTPAQRWFALAIEDLAAAHVLIGDVTTALRIAGFLAQQAAEKSLKAGLFAVGINVPKIHGLNQILACYEAATLPQINADDLDELDPWVIDGRYAADLPDLGVNDAKALLAAAQRVVDAVRAAVPAVATTT